MSSRRRCVFLDRDGVINAKPAEGEYIRSWSEFRFLPNAGDWIRLFNALDLLVVVVTNQRGIARGLMSAGEAAAIHARMVEELASVGARIDDVLVCPHEEGECDCRKPRPGLVLRAAAKWDIDLGASILIGDSWRDRELASACGLRYVEVSDGRIVRGV